MNVIRSQLLSTFGRRLATRFCTVRLRRKPDGMAGRTRIHRKTSCVTSASFLRKPIESHDFGRPQATVFPSLGFGRRTISFRCGRGDVRPMTERRVFPTRETPDGRDTRRSPPLIIDAAAESLSAAKPL